MIFKKTAKVIFSIQLFLTVFCFAFVSEAVAYRNGYVDSLITNITVDKEGTLNVQETVNYFSADDIPDPRHNGSIFYKIYYKSNPLDGNIRQQSVDHIVVKDINGTVHQPTGGGGNYVGGEEGFDINRHFEVGPIAPGLNTFLITYKAKNFTQFLADYDAIIWKKALSQSYDQFEDLNKLDTLTSEINITLPGLSKQANFEAQCSLKTNPEMKEKCGTFSITTIDSATVLSFHLDNQAKVYEKVDFSFSFDKGLIVPKPLWIEVHAKDVLSACLLVLLFAAGIFFLWYLIKYLPIARQRAKPIITNYEPPRGLTPSQIGLVYLKKSDLNKLIVSEITALSELGHITMEKGKRKNLVVMIVKIFIILFAAAVISSILYGVFSGMFMMKTGAQPYILVGAIIFFAYSSFILIRKVVRGRNTIRFTIPTDLQYKKVPPDHLVDLLDFLRLVNEENDQQYFFQKRLLRDLFDRIKESLPLDHLKERSVFNKKHYTTKKKKSFLAKMGIFILLMPLFFAPLLFIVAGIYFTFVNFNLFNLLFVYKTQVFFVIGTIILIRLLFVLKKYLINKIFFKTTLWYEVMGFRQYIDITEKERVKFFNDPHKSLEVYSKYLPYAIIFGLEKKWKNLFTPILGIGK